MFDVDDSLYTCFNKLGRAISSGRFPHCQLNSFCDMARRGGIFYYVTIGGALDSRLIDAVSKTARFKGIGRLSLALE